MTKDTVIVRNADWKVDNSDLKKIRQAVFINEQAVPESMEWDNEDTTALHCIATINNQTVATGRLQTDGQLGRMAVLKAYRNKGIGSLVLKHLITQHSLTQSTPLFLHAQKHAVNFYNKFNFYIIGDEFFEANIPHYLMQLKNNIT